MFFLKKVIQGHQDRTKKVIKKKFKTKCKNDKIHFSVTLVNLIFDGFHEQEHF